VPHPERAPLVRGMFERYATGQESDRSIAAWLNTKGARTVRDRPFGKDTVREMLCNASYAGYVSGLRDKTRAIRGLHEAIVPEELFDRVQEVHSWRTTVLKPGRSSEEYLLRKLVHCERCGARMHGCRSGNNAMRRYQCSTRRHHGNCEQRMIPAEPLEEQLVQWLHTFQPDADLRARVLDAIEAHAGTATQGEDAERRRELSAQLQRTAPPTNPDLDLDRAQALLENFARFWDTEPNPAERRKLIRTLFAQIWAKDRQIVAVKPHPAFAPYFLTATAAQAKRQQDGPSDEATMTGATGLEPAASGVTGRRSNQLSYAPASPRHATVKPPHARRENDSMPSMRSPRRARARPAPRRRVASDGPRSEPGAHPVHYWLVSQPFG
jgi:Recombinase/Recombinase zinc beta ribbon domain